MEHYRETFYRLNVLSGSMAAREIAPTILKLVAPKSVIDVGCSTGTWLAVFREFGVEDILGIDGPYVPKELLEIPTERFLTHDLDKPFEIERTFDLAISLETGEHLSPGSAPGFVNSLTRLAPVILFSAAIPFQGGDGHRNEQWPEYWAKLFQPCGYVPIDCLRMKFWNNPKATWWCAQNMMLYVRRAFLDQNSLLKHEFENSVSPVVPLIHPTRYLATADLRTIPVRRLLRALPAAFVRGLVKTFKKPPPPPWGELD